MIHEAGHVFEPDIFHVLKDIKKCGRTFDIRKMDKEWS